MTTTPRPSADLDVPRARLEADMERLVARQKFAARMAPLTELLAHPEAAAARIPADVNERAEYRHWLHDADPDSTVPAFRVDLIKHQQPGRAS